MGPPSNWNDVVKTLEIRSLRAKRKKLKKSEKNRTNSSPLIPLVNSNYATPDTFDRARKINFDDQITIINPKIYDGSPHSVESDCNESFNLKKIEEKLSLDSCVLRRRISIFEEGKPELRQKHLFLTKLCQKLERYDEMLKHVLKIIDERIKDGIEFTEDEKNSIEIAFKISMRRRKFTCKLLGQFADEISKNQSDSLKKIDLLLPYRVKAFNELLGFYEMFYGIFLELLRKTTVTKMRVFYFKMCGDFYRYFSDIQDELVEYRSISNAKRMYLMGIYLAQKELPPFDSDRISLTLNWAIFNYDILQEKKEAYEIAKDIFNKVVNNLDMISDSDYSKSAIFINRIRNLIQLWSPKDGPTSIFNP